MQLIGFILAVSSGFSLGYGLGKYKGENFPSWLKYTHPDQKIKDIFPL